MLSRRGKHRGREHFFIGLRTNCLRPLFGGGFVDILFPADHRLGDSRKSARGVGAPRLFCFTAGFSGSPTQKSDEKWSHRGNHDDLTNGAKTCIFNPDGIFGIHRRTDPRPTGRYQHLTTFRSVDAMHLPVQGIGGFASSAPSEQTRDIPSPPSSAEEFIMTVRG